MRVMNIWRVYKYLGTSGLLTAIWYGLRSALARVTGMRYIKRRIYDFEMFLDAQDKGISRTLLLFGKRELDHRYILQSVLEPGMTVFDIGANIGYYVLIESELMGDGNIIAVEPEPTNIELLKSNLEINGVENVVVISGAVSDRHGVRDFHLADMANLGTFHATGSVVKHLTSEVISVETWTVSEIMQEHGPPDLIRMDVEGHEVVIMDSMLDDILSGKLTPLILFETHLTRYSAENDMVSTLESFFEVGYQVRYLGSSSQAGTHIIKERGYKELRCIVTDFMVRSIFERVKSYDALDFICHTGGVRTVLLERATSF